MKNIFKGLGIGFIAIALVVGTWAGSAEAVLTSTATSTTSDGVLTLTGAATSAWSLSAGDLTVSAAAGAVNLTATGATAGDMAFTVGDDFTVNGAATSLYNIGAATTSGTIIIGGTAQTGLISLGDTASSTVTEISIGGGDGIKTAINIGDGAGANGINIGGAASNIVLTDAQWGVTGPGVGTLVNLLVSPSATTGVDVGSAGALSVGRVNATSVVIGSAATTAITLTTDATGDGTDVVLPTGAVGTTEILDDTLTVSDLAATLTFADGDVVDLSSTVTTTAAAKGLKLPQKTDCSLGVTEGHICWDTDNNALYVGDGAAAATVAGSTGGVNTWTDNQIFTFATDEDIAISNTTASTTDVLSLTVTNTDADAAQISLTLGNDGDVDTTAALNLAVTSATTADADVLVGLNIANLASADGTVVERGVVIGSGWDANALFADTTTQIQITDAGTFTFENVTGTDFLTLSATAGVLAGDLTITGGDITVSGEASTLTIIDNTANALVIESVTDGLDYLAITTTDGAETMVLGHSTVDSITLTTDGTGTAEVALPAGSIDSTEILDATIAAADLASSIVISTTGLITANGGLVQDYSTAIRADGFSAAGLNVINAEATTADLATITGGVAGQVITILFHDAVVITDNNAEGANSINIGAALTTADGDVLTLVFDGTSWKEVSRSVNG